MEATNKNLNVLSSNRAVLNIEKFKNISIQAQSTNIPSVNIAEAITPTPRVNIQIPGDKIEFDDLNIEFLVDENLEAWKEIHNWMIGIAAPQESTQFNKDEQVCDGTLHIYSSHNNEIMKFRFYDMWPSNLSTVDFTEEDSETVVKKANVLFKYMLYTVE